MKTTIKLEGIKKVYQLGGTLVHAVRGIDLTVPEGEMLAIMGASGSGKSTLLNIIGCLDRPTEGAYYLEDQDVSQLDKKQLASIRNKKLGFVFQGFNLLGRSTAKANVQLPMIYAGVEKSEVEDRAREALGWVGLSAYLNHLPGQMSGGQQQRVAIARALVNNPSVILADEPTGALDSRTSMEIMSVIQRLNWEKGITVVMVTHEEDIALHCGRIIRIKDGRIISDVQVSNPRNAAQELAAYPADGAEVV